MCCLSSSFDREDDPKITIIISVNKYPVIHTSKRGITLTPSFICWKIIYINCGQQMEAAIF